MLPVFLVSYNRLTCLSAMVEQLRRFDVRPIIVDNASTYPPLLDYLDRVDVEVIRLDEHLGKHAPWLAGLVPGDEVYCVSDPDLDLSGCPDDLFDVMRRALDRHDWTLKAGPSLEIEDIPDRPWRDDVVAWESQFWQDRLADGHFRGGLDTTLAIYRGSTPFNPHDWIWPAVRLARPYTARHTPWYAGEPTDEDRYYLEHARSETFCWSPRIYRADGTA